MLRPTDPLERVNRKPAATPTSSPSSRATPRTIRLGGAC
jgi:hypothetical protein